MDTTLGFRFVTRTLSEDYRIFSHGGAQRDYADEEEFAPVRRLAKIVPEHGPCAALFSLDGKVYLVVSSLERGASDFVGRQIRFSFCRIWQGDGETEKNSALKSFGRVCRETEGCRKKIAELLREVPVTRKDWQGKDVPGEDVHFEEKTFTDWLEAAELENDPLYCNYEGSFDVVQNVLPGSGWMAKWQGREPGKIVCVRLNMPPSPKTDILKKAKQMAQKALEQTKQHKVATAVGAAILAATVAGVAAYNRAASSNKPEKQEIPLQTASNASAALSHDMPAPNTVSDNAVK